MNSNEIDAMKVYEDYLMYYFEKRDFNNTSELLGEINGFGTGLDEVVPPNDMRELYKRDIEQIPHTIVVSNQNLYSKAYSDSSVIIWGTFDISSELDGIPFELNNLRTSVLMQNTKGSWLMEHLHISLPYQDQEDNESYPLEQLMERNKVLSHLVEKRTEELKNANDELTVLNAQKDKLMSIIAHDLRNPFNAILGYSNLLSTEIGNKDYHTLAEYIESLDTTVKQTYSLLESLLNWSLSQVGSNKLDIKSEKINIYNLTTDTITLLQNLATSKDITIENCVKRESTLIGDAYILTTILRNLISNSIKFTPVGGNVKIDYELSSSKEHLFKVTDNGIGVEKSKLESIFSFETEKTTTGTEGEKGTGLGLTVCKDFIEMLNGKIWCESEKNIGSCFMFTIPEKT